MTADTALVTALALLRADAPAEAFGRPEGWPRWALLLPHVLAATTHADTRSLAEDDRLVLSWLLDGAESFLHAQGRYREALPLAERALAIDEHVFGSDHPEVAIKLLVLAGVLRDLGEAEAAERCRTRAAAIGTASQGAGEGG